MRGSVEETLNELPEAEAEKLTQAARYERNEQRQGCRSGHYSCSLTTTSGEVTHKVLSSKGSPLRRLLLSGNAAAPAWWAVSRLRHIAGAQRGNKKHINMRRLEPSLEGDLHCLLTSFIS